MKLPFSVASSLPEKAITTPTVRMIP